MTFSFFRFFLILFGFACISTLSVYAGDSSQLQSIDIKPPFVVVEDLGAEMHTGSSTVTITGRIKNTSRSIIRGYATFYLLSLEGEEIYSFQEDVNGGKPFADGTTVDFEATSTVADLTKIGSISVDFTQE